MPEYRISHVQIITTLFSVIALLVCASTANARERVNVQQVRDWKAVSEQSVIIETRGRKKYQALLFSRCFGLRTADTIGFITRGSNSLDAFSSLVLPDGTRCRFKSFIELPEQPELTIQDDNMELTSE